MNFLSEEFDTGSRVKYLVLLFVATLMILLAPILGIVVALICIWHAILAGSIFYATLALLISLAGLSLFQSHRKRDFALLAAIATCIVTWFLISASAQGPLLEWGNILAGQMELLVGLLIIIVMSVTIYVACRAGNKQSNSRLCVSRISPWQFPWARHQGRVRTS